MVVFTTIPDQQFTVTGHMHIGDLVKVNAEDLMSLASSTVKNTIRFVPNTTTVVEECKHIVRKISDILNNFGHIHIRVDGHVKLSKKARKDPDMVEQARVLSAERADSILELLVSDGIAANRMTAKGFGADFPLPKGQDDKRVEITVVEQLDDGAGAAAQRPSPAVLPLDKDQKTLPVLVPQLNKGPPGQAPLPPTISVPTNMPVLEMFAGSPHKIVEC